MSRPPPLPPRAPSLLQHPHHDDQRTIQQPHDITPPPTPPPLPARKMDLLPRADTFGLNGSGVRPLPRLPPRRQQPDGDTSELITAYDKLAREAAVLVPPHAPPPPPPPPPPALNPADSRPSAHPIQDPDDERRFESFVEDAYDQFDSAPTRNPTQRIIPPRHPEARAASGSGAHWPPRRLFSQHQHQKMPGSFEDEDFNDRIDDLPVPRAPSPLHLQLRPGPSSASTFASASTSTATRSSQPPQPPLPPRSHSPLTHYESIEERTGLVEERAEPEEGREGEGWEGLPTYEGTAEADEQAGRDVRRFGRWRGWIEKRAGERYLDEENARADELRDQRRRSRLGWGEGSYGPRDPSNPLLPATEEQAFFLSRASPIVEEEQPMENNSIPPHPPVTTSEVQQQTDEDEESRAVRLMNEAEQRAFHLSTSSSLGASNSHSSHTATAPAPRSAQETMTHDEAAQYDATQHHPHQHQPPSPLLPTPIFYHPLGSRFIPHLPSPPLCLLPLSSLSLLLIGTATSLWVFDPRNVNDPSSGLDDGGAREMWKGMGVKDLRIVDSVVEREGGTPRGGVVGLTCRNDGERDDRAKEGGEMKVWQLGSLASLARWYAAQEHAPAPIDLSAPPPPIHYNQQPSGLRNLGMHGNRPLSNLATSFGRLLSSKPNGSHSQAVSTSSPFATSSAAITTATSSTSTDFQQTNPTFSPSIKATRPPLPHATSSSISVLSIDSDVLPVEDLPLRWARDYIVLPLPAGVGRGKEMAFWREPAASEDVSNGKSSKEKRARKVVVGVVCRSSVVVFESSSGRGSDFRFLKDFYLPPSSSSLPSHISFLFTSSPQAASAPISPVSPSRPLGSSAPFTSSSTPPRPPRNPARAASPPRARVPLIHHQQQQQQQQQQPDPTSHTLASALDPLSQYPPRSSPSTRQKPSLSILLTWDPPSSSSSSSPGEDAIIIRLTSSKVIELQWPFPLSAAGSSPSLHHSPSSRGRSSSESAGSSSGTSGGGGGAGGGLQKSRSNGKETMRGKGGGRSSRMRESLSGARESLTGGSGSVLEGLKGALSGLHEGVRDARRNGGTGGDRGGGERRGWVGGVREVWVDISTGEGEEEGRQRRTVGNEEGRVGRNDKIGFGLLTKGNETGIWKLPLPLPLPQPIATLEWKSPPTSLTHVLSPPSLSQTLSVLATTTTSSSLTPSSNLEVQTLRVSSLLSLLSATTTTTTRSERSERKSGESFDLEGVKGGRELGDGGAGFFGEEEEDAEADEDESMGVRWGWNSLGAEDYRVFGVGP